MYTQNNLRSKPCEKCGRNSYSTYRIMGSVKFVNLCDSCGEEEINKGNVLGLLKF